MQVQTQPQPQTEPSFGLSVGTTEWATQTVYDFILGDTREVAVCGLPGVGMPVSDLVALFKADQVKPCDELDYQVDEDDLGEAWSPDYATSLSFDTLRAATPADGPAEAFDRCYVVFAKDEADRVASYSAIHASLSFYAAGSVEPMTDPNTVLAWLNTSKRRNVTCEVQLNLAEVYSLIECRGRGMNKATLQHLAEGLAYDMETLANRLLPVLQQRNKRLTIRYSLYAEWHSRSGRLASESFFNMLTEEAEEACYVHKKNKWVNYANEVYFDAGY